MSPLSVSNPASSGVMRGPLSTTAWDKGPSTDGDDEAKTEELSSTGNTGDMADCTKDCETKLSSFVGISGGVDNNVEGRTTSHEDNDKRLNDEATEAVSTGEEEGETEPPPLRE